MANINQFLETQNELTESLLKQLQDLPNLAVSNYRTNIRGAGRHEIDLVIDVDCSGQTSTIFVEIKGGAIHPKRALEALRSLEDVKGSKMLVAPSLSEETRAFLKNKGVFYWDLSGSIFLDLPSGFYLIDRPPLPQPREGRKPKKVFKGSTAQVIHQVLLEPEAKWKVTELAEKAKVSAYTSQKALEYLESQLWVVKEGSGPQTTRRVVKPGKILDAWASAYDPGEYRTIGLHQYSRDGEEHIKKLEALMSRLDDEELGWGLTLEHGANHYAPLLTRLPSTLTALVPSSLNWKKEAEASGFKVVSSGENLRLLVSKSVCPFLGRERVRKLWVASPIQVYLDLYSWPQRGKDQAKHLREKRIGF